MWFRGHLCDRPTDFSERLFLYGGHVQQVRGRHHEVALPNFAPGIQDLPSKQVQVGCDVPVQLVSVSLQLLPKKCTSCEVRSTGVWTSCYQKMVLADIVGFKSLKQNKFHKYS